MSQSESGQPPPMSGGWTPWISGAPTLYVTGIRAFVPPNRSDTPSYLFESRRAKTADFPTSRQKVVCPGLAFHTPFTRIIRKSDPSEMLLFTDGACLDNGQAEAAAGCAFIYHENNWFPNPNGIRSFRLEDEGPDGQVLPQTSNRAELRAAIAALEFRLWAGEGFARVVVATSSEYVALGATDWVHAWKWNGWKTSDGKEVENRDLWERLLQVVGRHAGMRCEVLFWRIPRDLNEDADQAANRAAQQPPTKKYSVIEGVEC